ncbi:MAG: DNA ligase [Hymenobacter sp.]|nr:MAG: DNA ligase [Hymenobacter sp.]
MRNFLAYAAAKYYAGEPIITDDEFDKLAKQYNFEDVGAPVDISRAVPHAYRMYSLKKCFVGEPLIELPGEVIETPKLDGAAVSLFYIEGTLALALTRGDGKAGQDITDKMRAVLDMDYVPASITFQVTGEVMAKKSIPNARNYASGALNLKSMDEFRTRELVFVAYGVQPAMFDTWGKDMKNLYNAGFQTILHNDLNLDEYPQDGRVFRVNDNALFEELGFTDKHPRGAFALKEIQEGVVTTLQAIEWQVGRTGVVAPVAILAPVKVGDATVSRATLHNIGYIRDLNLELGCKVEIIRSGEIIPRVVRRVSDENTN